MTVCCLLGGLYLEISCVNIVLGTFKYEESNQPNYYYNDGQLIITGPNTPKLAIKRLNRV